MKIQVITTPNETLKETGFGSLKSCTSVLEAIRGMGHEVELKVCRTEMDLDAVVAQLPDLVVLAVKYLPGFEEEDLWLSDYFAKKGVNHSGSIRAVLRFDSDKVLAKEHLRECGVRTADFFLTAPGEHQGEASLPFPFPLFMKPLDAANGNGVDDQSLVTNFADYESKLASLHDRFEVPILVETYLSGREYTVAVMRLESGELVVSPIEIVPPESGNGCRILGEEVKKADSEELRKTEAGDMMARVRKLAIDSFESLGVRDFGRIDIKTDDRGNCYFMEANLVPGMTSGSSYFPLACEIASGLSYESVIRTIINSCLSRITPKVLVPQGAGAL